MTTEPKLMTEAEWRNVMSYHKDIAIDYIRERGLISEEPVDSLHTEALELAAQCFELQGDDKTAREIRNGVYNHEVDDLTTLPGLALAALHRGREIGLAERPTLTREMVRELIIDARPKYLSPGDFEGRYGKKNKEAAEAFVTRIHAALTEACK